VLPTGAEERDGYGLLFMPRNALVEDEMLDAIAFQGGFVGGDLIGCIDSGHKTSNTSIVLTGNRSLPLNWSQGLL
jgi:hypothetical protein